MMVEYEELKQRILTYCNNSIKLSELRSLKMIYADQINSPRRLYLISSLDDLITILEKRAFGNIKLLNHVAHHLNFPVNADISKTYMPNTIKMSTAYTQKSNNDQICNEQYNQKINGKNSASVLQKVYEMIANDIGKKWKDMARGLNVGENEIDEIVARYNNDIKSQVFAVFTLVEGREDERDLKPMLCKALDRARRKDLRQSIEKEMLWNI